MCEIDKGDLALAVLEPVLVRIVSGVSEIERIADHRQICPNCNDLAKELLAHKQNHTVMPIQRVRERVMIGG
jgi:hypothetical protein